MIKITPIPALTDNYIWILQQDQNAMVFDPSEAQPVLQFLAGKRLDLAAILLTHNHHDHTGGVAEIRAAFPDVPVYGPEETNALRTETVQPEQRFELLGLNIDVIESAGHTTGHISYLINREYLFCGDSLFSGGCGRVFTGDYQAQFDALQRFKQLPDFVEVFPAHEYTQSNLKFAEAVMPPSCYLLEIQEQVDILRANHRPSLPTTIEKEKRINPFLQAETLDEFIALRKQKDQF
ncbi:MAG: hydroxyacylglutathione hydrolase [Pasteurellaceae bacterium]|nr:hydroxyacylglutathione hydrolase [Pasteurellaceae bacterium]